MHRPHTQYTCIHTVHVDCIKRRAHIQCSTHTDTPRPSRRTSGETLHSMHERLHVLTPNDSCHCFCLVQTHAKESMRAHEPAPSQCAAALWWPPETPSQGPLRPRSADSQPRCPGGLSTLPLLEGRTSARGRAHRWRGGWKEKSSSRYSAFRGQAPLIPCSPNLRRFKCVYPCDAVDAADSISFVLPEFSCCPGNRTGPELLPFLSWHLQGWRRTAAAEASMSCWLDAETWESLHPLCSRQTGSLLTCSLYFHMTFIARSFLPMNSCVDREGAAAWRWNQKDRHEKSSRPHRIRLQGGAPLSRSY